MGLQIRTYVDGQQKYIDLYGDEDVTIDVSFAEIQDITRKNSAYTQEFKVPGTNNNNDIFNYFFEINSVALDWNPKRKFEASLIYNGYEIFAGNVRLNQVTILIKEKVYSVTFYASIGDLVSNIGDKALCNVDTSSLNHSLYEEDVADYLFDDPSLHPPSLTYLPYLMNPVTEGKVQYTLGQRGYDYTGSTYGTIRDIDTQQTPILNFSGAPGFFDNQYSPLISSYFIPSIRTRDLYSLIVNQADYQIESSFFDTDYFGRYYIPLSFNTENPYMAQAREYKYTFVNNSGTTYGMHGGRPKVVHDVFPNTDNNQFLIYPKDITEENLDFNPIQLSNYPVAVATAGLALYSDVVFAIPLAPVQKYTLKLSYTTLYSGPNDPFGPGETIVGAINLYRYDNGTTLKISGYNLESFNIVADTEFSGNTYSDSYLFDLEPAFSYEHGTELYFLAVDWFVGNVNVTNVSLEIVSSPVVLPYTIELYKEMNCDQKQIEFIQNVNKMFNLVVVPHPIKPKTLIIEPIVDYIGKGRVLDWTEKVDFNSPQTLRPTTSLINGSIFASNKMDKDFVNVQYNVKSNKIFGQKIIDLGIDYKNVTINLTQTLGQNTDYYLNASGATNIALPCYFVLKQGNNNGIPVFEYRPFRSLPRMIFKSVPLSSGNTGGNAIFYRYAGTNTPFTVNGLVSTGTIPNINRLTTYPFAVSGFSHYTTYDSSTVFTPDELVYPEVETQYDRYYNDYVEDLISEENKIYNCRMYLTPWDVSNLYCDEVIYIKNAKFRINKITGLSLIDPNICNVELVKLTRDYTPTPTLFYDLIDCDDNCNVIHCNTDICYLLFAFENQFVTLSFYRPIPLRTKRFKVVRTEYNENYTYEKIYFTKGRTIGGTNPNDYYIGWDYTAYDSCSATTEPFTLNVYNDFTGTTINCSTIIITNPTLSTLPFTYTDCYGTKINCFINGSTTYRACGVYGSFEGSGLTFCNDVNVLVCTETPLPCLTPTPTPTRALTPTPTPTPTHTPTTTPLSKVWQITTCTSSCKPIVGQCFCLNPVIITVYTSFAVTDITANGTLIYTNSTLTTPFIGLFQKNGSIWYSDSDVTEECIVGGTC